MPQVMTTNAIVVCPHGGIGTSTPLRPKWRLAGGLVLRENDPGVLSCVNLPPCVGYQLRSMGLNATRLDGARVILVTDFNQSFTGLPLRITETHRTIDNSTLAPFPPGGQAPPLTPELADATPPVVTATPPAPAFVTATMQPATAVVTFTLAAAFPMSFILTRVSGPPRADHADLTGGDPAGAVVVPAGGGWSTPSLTVTLTMSAPYMSQLGPGAHHFYLTGVSRRGLSGYAEAVLTVS